MANKVLFGGARPTVPVHNAINEAGGAAFYMGDKHALAQYVITGTFNGTFYASAGEQLDAVKHLCSRVDDEFLAKCAIYARIKGRMKDTPAYLCAVLATRNIALLERVFPIVINNGKMLANFVQIIRSGAVGRKSFGTALKRIINNWLNSRDAAKLFETSVGVSSPSMTDIVKMTHPRPEDREHNALYAYLIDREFDLLSLPANLKGYLAFKNGESKEVPNVPFQLLTSLPLGTEEWTEIAKNAPWNMTRMNLNTFARHGVFNDKGMIKLVAERLRDPELVRKFNAFPYQLLTAWQNTADVPMEIRNALQDAMELATYNIPAINGDVVVAVDISGSMTGPVTGYRAGSTTKTSCMDVAGMFASCLLRTNQNNLKVVSFDTQARFVNLNPRDSVPTNVGKILSSGGGGTDCSAALRLLIAQRERADVVIYLSDNESWRHFNGTQSQAWAEFNRYNKSAKLVCIDLQPYSTVQTPDSQRVLNVGGFSDSVFEVVANFVNGGDTGFVKTIEAMTIGRPVEVDED